MSVIGGQNPIVQNGLVYILDFGNQRSYVSGSSTAQSLVYNPVTASFTGSSLPNLINGLAQFTDNTTLITSQSFSGFSYNQGNLTIIFAGQTKDVSTLFTQDGTVAVVSTTSSIGYGSSQGNLGRNFPAIGLNHVSLRFTTGSVDCFINGIPTGPTGIFPTAPSSSTFNDFKVAGNHINTWTGSYSGSLGNLLVYNRELSDNEIYAIYSQQARRYGLIEQDKPYTTDSSVYAYTQAAGITGSSVITALDAFVVGLKANNLWNKMIAIYPFLGSDTTKTRYNLKDPSLNTTQINYSGSWSSSDSGSYNNNTSSYGIMRNIKGDYFHPLISSQSIHLSYLSYDTPVSGGYLMGAEQLPGLPGDIAAPAAAYSVRKVRTAYTGSALRVRRDFDDLSFDVGFDGSGNLDTGSLLTNMTASGITEALPGDYSGLAAAYSLRKVSSSYSGYAVEVQSGSVSQSIGFNIDGNLDTGSLLSFVGSGNAYVKTWYDQSGNNNHATQSVTSSQPLIVNNGVIVTENGKPALSFDGTDDYFTLNPFSVNLSSGFSGFAVNVYQSVNNHRLFSMTTSPNLDFTQGGLVMSTRQFIIDSDPSISIPSNGDGTQDLNTFISTNNTATYYRNNLLQGSDIFSKTNTITPDTASIGIRSEDLTSSALGGLLQELLLYTSSQTTNRTLIEDNINGYYNIFTHSLDSGSGYVTTWYDQSGNDRHVSQSVAANQPLILSSGSINFINTKPGINFGYQGVSAAVKLATAAFPVGITSPYTVFTTFKATLDASQTIYDGLANNNQFNYNSNGYNLYSNDNTAGVLYGTGTTDQQTHIHIWGPQLKGAQNTSALTTGATRTVTLDGISLGHLRNPALSFAYQLEGSLQEVIFYASDQSSNRAPIQQNINRYFNIYTQPAYNQNTNSLSLFSSPTLLAGGANAVPTQLITGGPTGLITVSRTGSSDYTLWKNRVPTKTTLPASTPLSNEIYLNSANLSNALFSGSQNNVSYASVGAGLTDDEVYTYYELVDNLQTSLNRENTTDPNAFITVWNTTLSGNVTDSTIILPFTSTTFVTASWGDGTESYISSSGQLDRTHSYAEPGVYTVTITGQFSGFSFGNNVESRKITDIVQWGNSPIFTLAYARNLLGTAPDKPRTPGNFPGYWIRESGFNGYVNDWDLSKTTTFTATFYNNNSFNQNIGGWDVSNVVNFGSEMFWGAGKFNNGGSPDINNWKFSPNLTSMVGMFRNASVFNQPLGNWDTSNIIGMNLMFSGAPRFNQNIGAWNVEKVTNMSSMLPGNDFNNGGSPDINNWRPISCSNFSSMFNGAKAFNQPIGNWPLSASNITMYRMFYSGGGTTPSFDQNIGSWNVSGIISMQEMFHLGKFNNSGSADINNWRPVSCSNFSGMFHNNGTFNQPIGGWELGTGSHMNVTMSNMFRNSNYNQDLGAWNVEKVTNMTSMFQNSSFKNSGSTDINNWRPISCSNFNSMFQSATAFNQPIGNWPLSASNINMSSMFSSATAFNQDIGSWNVGNVTNFTNFMAGKTAANYSYLHTIYDGWINYKLQPNLTINFNTIDYSASAAEGKALLERTSFSASIIDIQDNGGNFQISGSSVAEGLSSGNKITISGSGNPVLDKAHAILDILDVNTFTVNVPFTASAAQGEVITGYGWNITDGDPV